MQRVEHEAFHEERARKPEITLALNMRGTLATVPPSYLVEASWTNHGTKEAKTAALNLSVPKEVALSGATQSGATHHVDLLEADEVDFGDGKARPGHWWNVLRDIPVGPDIVGFFALQPPGPGEYPVVFSIAHPELPDGRISTTTTLSIPDIATT
jgi:hypothetical protein